MKSLHLNLIGLEQAMVLLKNCFCFGKRTSSSLCIWDRL